VAEPVGDVEGDGSGVTEVVAEGVAAGLLVVCVGVGAGDGGMLGVSAGVDGAAAVGVRVGLGVGEEVAPEAAAVVEAGCAGVRRGDSGRAAGAATMPAESPPARAAASRGRCGRMPFPGAGVDDWVGQVAPTGCRPGIGGGPTNRPATYAPTGTVTNTATAMSAFPRIDMEPCFPVLGE